MTITTRPTVPEVTAGDFEPDQYRYAFKLVHETVRVIERIRPERRGVLTDVLMALDKYTGGPNGRIREL